MLKTFLGHPTFLRTGRGNAETLLWPAHALTVSQQMSLPSAFTIWLIFMNLVRACVPVFGKAIGELKAMHYTRISVSYDTITTGRYPPVAACDACTRILVSAPFCLELSSATSTNSSPSNE